MRTTTRRLMTAISLAGCVAATATAAHAGAMSEAEARAIVEARNDTFEALFKANDAKALATQMYTPGGRLVPPDAPDMVGPEAIAAYWTGATGALGEVKLETVEAVPAGPGYIVERVHVTLFAEDGSAAGGGKAVVLWTLQDGVWRMQWDSWNNGPVK